MERWKVGDLPPQTCGWLGNAKHYHKLLHRMIELTGLVVVAELLIIWFMVELFM